MRCRWRVSPTRPSTRTWPRSSRRACARRSASRWRIREFAKGLVKRDVVRIVTPGTLTDDELLDPKTANYLAAVVEVGGKLGLAWVELSTGRFSLTEPDADRAHRRDRPAQPGRDLDLRAEPRCALGRHAPRASRGRRSRFARRGTSSPSRPARRSSSSSGRRRWPDSASTIGAWRSRPPARWRPTCARRRRPRWDTSPG